MHDQIHRLGAFVGCEDRGYVDEAVRQDPGQKAPALVKNERKDKAHGNRENHLDEGGNQLMSGKKIYNMSHTEGDGGNDDGCFHIAVLQHGFEQEASEDQFLCKSDQSHGYSGIEQSRYIKLYLNMYNKY